MYCPQMLMNAHTYLVTKMLTAPMLTGRLFATVLMGTVVTALIVQVCGYMLSL